MNQHKTRNNDGKMVKLIVSLGSDSWHGFAEEEIWVKPVGTEAYEVHNTPFFAKGIAYLDVVSAKEAKNRLVLDRIVRPSRHSTYRALVQRADDQRARELMIELSRLDSTYEVYDGPDWRLYAFDVPAKSVDAAYKVLQRGADDHVWDFDEGHFGGREQ
jgi:hypothetical protein